MKIEVNGYVLEVPDDFNDEQIGAAVDEFAGEMGFTPESQDKEVDGMPIIPTVEPQAPVETDPYTQLDTGWLGKMLGADVAIPTEEAAQIDRTPEQVAADMVALNPDMSPDDAMAKALTQHRQAAAKNAINLSAAMIPGAKPVQLALSGLAAGGGGEVASQAIEALTDPNAPDKSITDRLSNVLWEGGKDAAINVVAGKAGEKIVGGLENTYRWLKGMAPKGMDDLSRAGSETAKKVDDYRKEYDLVKGGEAENLQKQEMIYAKQKAAYDEDVSTLPAREAAYVAEVNRFDDMVSLGTLTRRQADAAIAEIPKPVAPVEPTKLDYDAMFNKGIHDDLEAKYLDSSLESMEGVTARNIYDAEAKASTLLGREEDTFLNRVLDKTLDIPPTTGGFKVGTTTLSEQVDNFNLSQQIRNQSLARELDDAKALGFIPMSKKMQEAIGLRDPDLYRVRDKAVKSELSNIYDDLKNVRQEASPQLQTVLADLEEATSKVFEGNSKEAASFLKSAKSKTDRNLDLGENKAAHSLRRQIESLSKIKTKATSSSSSSDADSILSSALKFGGAGVVGTGLYDFSSEGKIDAGNLAIAGALGFVGRKAAGKISTTGIDRRMNQVKKALGGKYKIDEVARQMIESGSDMGKVIAYIVLADMRENENK